MSDESENSGANSETKPELVPQPHGGSIYRGGMPGNRGGTGRPPSELRQEVRGIFTESLPALREFALGERTKKVKHTATGTCTRCLTAVKVEVQVEVPLSVRDQLKAIEMAGKIGLDVRVDKSLCDELWAAVESDVPEDVLPKLRHKFNRIIGRRLAESVVT